jgi:hypothetical protein
LSAPHGRRRISHFIESLAAVDEAFVAPSRNEDRDKPFDFVVFEFDRGRGGEFL